jgi:uncharacterized membrane protein YqgA involved in biofilm formation
MIGTVVNTSAIVMGSIIGVSAGRLINDSLKQILMQALGLAVVVIGIDMALSVKNLIPSVACLLLGALTGELMKIERGVELLGQKLKNRFSSGSSTFVQGFVTATILYLSGPMMVIGCLQDGTIGNPDTLYLKSLLDGVASIAISSTLGIGVAFSAASVLVVQGSLTLLASYLTFLQEPAVLSAITATGGMIILGIGTNLLGITIIRVGNLIPSLVYAAVYPVIFL